MGKPQKNWIERPGHDPEKAARQMRQRFSKVTNRYERAVASRRFLRSRRATILMALLAAGVAFLIASALV